MAFLCVLLKSTVTNHSLDRLMDDVFFEHDSDDLSHLSDPAIATVKFITSLGYECHLMRHQVFEVLSKGKSDNIIAYFNYTPDSGFCLVQRFEFVPLEHKPAFQIFEFSDPGVFDKLAAYLEKTLN